MTHHPIVIVGAGLGGLALARVLHAGGVDAVVLELEASRAARTQGGMLDIHAETGQAALRAAGLYDEFLARTLTGGDATRVLDRHGVVVHEDAGDGDRPEIDRGDLRDLLLDSIPEVRWGTKVTGAARVGERWELSLADGGTLTTDLLVGADGAWSRVRPLLSPAVPAFTGISFVELDLFDADARHPGPAATIGTGSLFALGGGRAFLAHRESDGSLHVYVALPGSEPPATKETLVAAFPDWAPEFHAIVEEADGPLVTRLIHALPVGLRWERVPGVTLLGDAAHLMSPFAGEGANLALIDGADLGRAVLDHPGDVEAALAAYEKAMFARAETAAGESREGQALLFADDAPHGLVEMFTTPPAS